MKYGSVCSGIEAATAAWHPLGWKPSFFSEIEAFPRAVLAHHYPSVPLHGDFTTIQAGMYEPIDLLVGGTPCQSFSIAGLRGGLSDDRGNLALEYLRLAQRLRPRWLVWENVPGVLSSNEGRDFGAILGGMVELGYGIAYRVLDAQHFGVPQRRRRVFVVGYLGDWRRAAAVLFERHSLSGNPPPSREARKDVAPTISARTKGGGGLGTDFDLDGGCVVTAPTLRAGGNKTGGDRPPGTDVDTCDSLVIHCPDISPAMKARDHKGPSSDGDGDGDGLPLIAHALRGEGFDASEDGTGRGTPLVPVACIKGAAIGREPQNGPQYGEVLTDGTVYTLNCIDRHAVAFQSSQSGVRISEVHATLDSNNGPRRHNGAIHGSAVRRLAPRECERLQGFPDDYTLIPYRNKPAADGPRYKALGNSMAVPVMSFIGRRIQMVEAIP